MTPGQAMQTMSLVEAVQLGAADGVFFSMTFFPKTFRQPPALFHSEIWELLEDPQHREVALSVFRGSAKTTLLRTFLAKRIAYGISRTALFLGASQANAVKSTMWLKARVEEQGPFARAFKLTPGTKWTEDWLEIVHGIEGHVVNVVGMGVTGSIRGLNIEDYRPDLIIGDDLADDENMATEEQRKKVEERWFGAIAKSLAPSSEAPNAKRVLLNTPIHTQDLITKSKTAIGVAYREYSCFNEYGESTWPARFPTKELQTQKLNDTQRGHLHTWTREMEVRLVQAGNKDFNADDMQFWHEMQPGLQMPTFLYIDPVPPPEKHDILPKRTDYEALAVVGIYQGNFMILDVVSSRGHQPDWTIAQFFMLCAKWKPVRVKVEGIAYQRTLKWILEQEMNNRRVYWPIEAPSDQRHKRHKILQGLKGPLNKKKVYAHPSQSRFLTQLTDYPHVDHDDDIEAVAGAMEMAQEYAGVQAGMEVPMGGGDEEQLSALNEGWNSCP